MGEVAEGHSDSEAAVVLDSGISRAWGSSNETYAERDTVVGISDGREHSSENERSEHL